MYHSENVHEEGMQLFCSCEWKANNQSGSVDGAAAPQVPVWLLKATRSFLKSFQWARDAADRLVSTNAFA